MLALIVVCLMAVAFLAGWMGGNRQVRRFWRLEDKMRDMERTR